MKTFEIWIGNNLEGYTTGKSLLSVVMRLRRYGWKTSLMDILEVPNDYYKEA